MGKSVNVKVDQSLYQGIQEIARDRDRDVRDVLEEAIANYVQQRLPSKSQHSLLDHQPISVGRIKKPWKSRADMLEHYFDDRD